MIIRFLTLLLFSFSQFTTQAQICDCGNDMRFLTERYQKDYSGFQDYQRDFPNWQDKWQDLGQQADATTDVLICHELLGKLIGQINNGHVVYGALKENPRFEDLTEAADGDRDVFPSLTFPDAQTALLAIRTGDLDYKLDLDTLLVHHQNRLDSCRHLIIDLRGNSGGGDATFDNVLPYLYTGPIISHGASLWASENNIALFEQYLGNPNVPEDTKQEIGRIVSTAKANPGTFVPLREQLVDTIRFDTVMERPDKVSVLIDGRCTSATEEFLLKAKQSAKTTIYGAESSGGALDYSNLNPVITPSGFWYATVPTTRSNRLPTHPVDPHGIAPDVLIGEGVGDMVEYVMQQD
jgi:hypothetical protein